MRLSLLICLSVLLSSCSFFSFFNKDYVGRKAERGLSQEYAMIRSAQISQVKYYLDFDLTREKTFRGITNIVFQLRTPFPLTIDFTKGQVRQIQVNGELVEDPKYNGYFITIPESYLRKGQNKIQISYSHEYSKNGVGLYRYKDLEDGKDYLYSDFEPYDANQLFPCFDQPDLKATYTTKVKAPAAWHVITSTKETEKVLSGDVAHWTFPESEKFSTYTYSLHAGDYYVWEDEVKTKTQTIPLRLFARHTIAPYVDSKEWFDLTKAGFPYFEKLYSYKYPYVKYDQLIVPDFNSGAMENVAAVTFNEDRYVTRGEKTRAQKRRLASTLLHEMAHMWFGNLVTMKWWDDLWLNESFATYSASRALAEATEYKEAWQIFNVYKQGAYSLDQSVATHPIVADVPSTEEAFANFDSITYGKGASVLKQMAFYLGDSVYKKGLKKYFSKHAHGNTVLSDFMDAMEEASKKDMKLWQQRWLETAMLNTVEAHYTCKKGRVKQFELYQTATKEYPVTRPHKTKVAFFRKVKNSYRLSKLINVTYQGESTPVKKAVGVLCPDLVYPNFKDMDYVKVALNEKSVENIKEGLSLVEDRFLRSLLWQDLWQMVLDQKMSAVSFLEIVELQGLVEKDRDVLSSVLRNVSIVLKSYFPDESVEWNSKKQKWVKFFESAYQVKIEQSKEDKDLQRLWFDHLVSISESPELHNTWALMLKTKKRPLPLSFKLDQDRRWKLLYKLASFGHPQSKALLTYERSKDLSNRGALKALSVDAAEPRIEVKEKMLRRIVNGGKKDSLSHLKTIMRGLFPENQKTLQRKLSDRYFDLLKNVSQKKDPLIASTFARTLVPALCDNESTDKIKSFVKKEKLPFFVVKTLKVAAEKNEKCTGIKALLKSPKTQKVL